MKKRNGIYFLKKLNNSPKKKTYPKTINANKNYYIIDKSSRNISNNTIILQLSTIIILIVINMAIVIIISR